MTQFTRHYINIWYQDDEQGNREHLIHEQSPICTTVDGAIDNYNEESGVWGEYLHTIVFDYRTSTLITIDIEREIEDREDEDEQTRLAEKLEDEQYGSYEDQVRSYYNSTRL